MKRHSATIDIDASPAAVWQVLTDTAAWPEFDPYCDRIEGRAVLGGTVKAYTKLAPGRAFPVEVTRMDAPRDMVWSGGMPLGLFTGVRTYSIAPLGNGARFTLTETFDGPLLPFFAKSLPDMDEPFAAFCDGLKRRVEGETK